MTRLFARTALDQTSPIAEQTADELDARGGMGDEVTYTEATDTFTCDDVPGNIPNPVPGNALAGASALIHSLEDAGPQGLNVLNA